MKKWTLIVGLTGAYARLDLSEINAPSEAISNPEVQVDAFAEVRLYHSKNRSKSPQFPRLPIKRH
jgi:hypothetical protein